MTKKACVTHSTEYSFFSGSLATAAAGTAPVHYVFHYIHNSVGLNCVYFIGLYINFTTSDFSALHDLIHMPNVCISLIHTRTKPPKPPENRLQKKKKLSRPVCLVEKTFLNFSKQSRVLLLFVVVLIQFTRHQVCT